MGYVDPLTDEEREDIRREFAQGKVTIRELAHRWGTHDSTIRYILKQGDK